MNYDGNYPCGPDAVKGEYRQHTVDVGSLGYKNAWGLYDMHGNVYEWCEDWYGNYLGYDTDNPHGALSGSYRAYRGGSWSSDAARCRVSYRDRSSPGYRYGNLGFRVVLLP